MFRKEEIFLKRLLAVLMLFVAIISGCQQKKIDINTIAHENNADNSSQQNTTPEIFLKNFNLKVQGNPNKFKIEIPKSWDVKAGEYPEGLYWTLANVFSKDAGLDLALLKGRSVDVWKYSLVDGLPGTGSQSSFKYPSNAILLVDNNMVVGAWLAFNITEIGPSVKKHYLKDITGVSFEDWIQKEKIFDDLGKNKDIASLDPAGLLQAFFKAIDTGDKTRAYTCIDPNEMLNSLTMNLGENRLYNPRFDKNNSMVENIIKAEAKSFRFMDPGTLIEMKDTGNQKQIEAAIGMNIKWLDSAFNTPDGNTERYTILRQYNNGWRLQGLGTGP